MSDHPSAMSGVFHRPFTEQVAFFRRKLKNLVPTRRWDDLTREAHDDAFMVAGATKADLLTDLAAAVDKAIAEGRGIEEFRRDFRAIVAKNGWTGWTGEGSVKGEAWRVGVIYRTNAYTSYAAGRHAQLAEGKFAFWVYRHGGSLEPRLEHLSWDGLALEPGHEFWRTHYPPSDWGCSCYVVGARSEAGVRRLGGDPKKALPRDWKARDPKTGAPVGIGRGWDYAPGASVSDAIQAMALKLNKWDHRIATAYLEDLPPAQADAVSDAYRGLPSTADDARRFAQRVFSGSEKGTKDTAPLPSVRTLGMAKSEHIDRINEALGGEAVDERSYDFSLDLEFMRHIRKEHGPGSKDDTPILPADFAILPLLVSSPDSIRPGDTDKPGLPRVKLRKDVGGKIYEGVFELRGGRRSLALKSFYFAGYVK